ncbi:MAG: L-threonylcarbamoyladenylate synthase [Actinomycetia bacterium]|nr:L-threonylcarbamoyladenylate synthase [Actinomycetes bacterium]MCP4084688.1 L-threonylcarbamoyladenylate synthase [Actinomycetes bacterium]
MSRNRAVPTGTVEDALELVLGAFARSEPAVVPTDTVYGFMAPLRNGAAVERIFLLKQRPADQPLAVLVGRPSELDQVAQPCPVARALANRFWPGALTLVVEARPGVGEVVGARDGTIGVRCADDELVRRITASVGPVAATSANLHGQPTPDDPAVIARQFVGTLVLDGGARPAPASAVVRVGSGGDVEVLRNGTIDPDQLSSAARAATTLPPPLTNDGENGVRS